MSGLTLGNSALLIGVLAYVLKRWWDGLDSLTAARREAYLNYYQAAYEMVATTTGALAWSPQVTIKDAHDNFQKSTPEFYLHASPTAINISDVFYRYFRDAAEGMPQENDLKDSGSEAKDFEKMNEGLILLREVMKSELYSTSPRFLWERFRHKRKYEKYVRDVAS